MAEENPSVAASVVVPDIASLDSDLKQKFYTFLFFDLDEPVSLNDLAILWGFSAETWQDDATKVCETLEKKSLLKKADDTGEFFVVSDEAIYNDAINRVKKDYSYYSGGALLAKLRLRTIDGDSLLETDSSVVNILAECLVHQRRRLLEKIADRISARALGFLCRQRCHYSLGRSFLHFLYNTPWFDDGCGYTGKKHSFRLVINIVKKLRQNKIDEVDVLKVRDPAGDCLLAQLFDEETKYEEVALTLLKAYPRHDKVRESVTKSRFEGGCDRGRLHSLLKNASHEYEEIKWKREELDKESLEDPLVKAAVSQSATELDEFLKNCKKTEKLHLAIKCAARLGKTANVQVLLAHCKDSKTVSANVRKTDHDGRTPLLLAAANGHLDTVKLLNEECPTAVEVADRDNCTPFLAAAATGQLDTVRYLYEKNPAIATTRDGHGNTALSLAAANGHLAAVEFLHEIYPQAVETVNSFDETPLALAAHFGYLPIVRFLHDKFPAAAEKANKLDETAISRAAANGHYETVKFLYKHHPDAIKRTYRCDQTLLAYASDSGNLQLVTFLHHEDPAAVEKTNANSQLPLTLAAIEGNPAVVRFLYEHNKAAIKNTDTFGKTPVLHAASGHLDVIQFLHQQDPSSVQAADKSGRTALSLAAEEDQLEIVKYLQNAYPAAVEQPDKEKKRLPISWAAKEGNLDVVKFLLPLHPAGIKAKDSEGKTTSALANKSGNKDLVQFLKEADGSASPTSSTKAGAKDTAVPKSSLCSCCGTRRAAKKR